MSLQPNILFFFETAAGLGHMRRTSAIVNQLVDKGAKVTVASGSFQSPKDFFDPRVTLLRLNPLVSKNSKGFYRFAEDGEQIKVKEYDQDKWQAERARIVRKAIDGQVFHAIAAEYWPFSRQVSFNKAIDAAVRSIHRTGIHPLIISSARDVLHTKNAAGKLTEKEMAQEARALAVIKDRVDYIMVHGDPRIITFDQGFAAFDQIKKKVHYTGFVVTPIEKMAPSEREKRVIVSVGAGTVGAGIIKNVFNAHSLVEGLEGYEWTYIFGPRMSDDKRAELKRQMDAFNCQVPDGRRQVVYHDFVPNLPEMLGSAEYSVSMGGYNTTSELLASGAKGIIIPKILKSKRNEHEFESCPEQAGRALQLEQYGFLSVIDFAQTVDREQFAMAIRQKFDSAASGNSVDFSGAEKSASFIIDKVNRRFRALEAPKLILAAN